MSSNDEQKSSDARSEFERLDDQAPLPLWREFLLFIRENKKWWLIPLLLTIGLLAVAAWLATTGAAPFIYPLF